MTTRFELVSPGTITSPRGFLAGAVFSGIKVKRDNPLDLGILLSQVPCVATGVFTTNKIKAAPVILCQEYLAQKRARAVVVNSGCANACTGEQGLADAREIAAFTAQKLGCLSREVLVASTGVIGMCLPLSSIQVGIERIALSPQGGHQLARAIMTTDTFPKEIAVKLPIGKREIILGGVAKGAGMIHPNLATMLCFLATDGAVEDSFLEQAVRQAVEASFNMITVDGDTSPNDTVLLLANGLAGNPVISAESPEAESFQIALQEVCTYLAKSIVRDGEGATKLIEVTVEGALSLNDARTAARTIAGSPLVKTAVHGCDPNWGRIIAALGRSGAEIANSRIDLYLDDLPLMKQGCPLSFDREKAQTTMLNNAEVNFRVHLNLGKEKATAWGCDLSEEYVTINSAYTT